MANETEFQSNLLKVRLVTPERILVDTDAASVTLPGAAGILEALPGAAPLLTAIGAGDFIITGGEGGEQKFIIACGFAEVLPDRVTVLAEYAQKPEEVDRAAAEELLTEGRKAISEAGQDPTKYDAARALVLEAEAKLGTPGQ